MRSAAGPLACAFAAVAGARLGERGSAAVMVMAAAAVVAALAVASLMALADRRALAVVVVAIAGAASMARALDGLNGSVATLAEEGRSMTARVTLVDDPRQRFRQARVLARIEEMADEAGPLPGAGTVVALTATGPNASRLVVLGAGEQALVVGALAPLRGRSTALRWRHAAAGLRVDDVLAAGGAGAAQRAANRIRSVVLAGTRRIPFPDQALVAGVLIGDDRHLPPVLSEEFRRSGLAHLLVVSGANVAYTLALARPLLTRTQLTARFAVSFVVIGLFATVTRFEPSVLRACAMAGLALTANYVGRPTSGLRILGLAVATLVVVDPFLAHSTGFGLSVGASAGILVLAPALSAALPGPRWWREAAGVTLAAQVGAAPVAVPAFGAVPAVALVANSLAVPLAAAVTLAGFPGAVAAAWLEGLWSAGADAVVAPAALAATLLRAVAAVAARSPVQLDGPGVAVVAAVGAWWVRRRPRRAPDAAPEPPPSR